MQTDSDNELRIILMRHGFSEGNENPDNYTRDGDSAVKLTDLGWQQAIAAGRFLRGHLGSVFNNARVWTSSFERARQTTAGLLYGAAANLPAGEVRTSPFLIEKDFGIFSHIQDKAERERLFPHQNAFYEAARKRDSYHARPVMGKSPADVQADVSHHIQTIMRDAANGKRLSVHVTHGVTLRVMAMAFMHIDPRQYRNFRNPKNASLYEIRGTRAGGYSLIQIYDGEAMTPVNVNWGHKLKAGQTYLPDVPAIHRQ